MLEDRRRFLPFFAALVSLLYTVILTKLDLITPALTTLGVLVTLTLWMLSFPVGPRSVLLGAHQFLIHPLFVAAAWWKLYGVPWDPRLWVAFFIHDFGYLTRWCHNMDGEEGEKHVLFGAAFMMVFFGEEWGRLCLFHSRFYARQHNHPFSRLCVADKLAFCLEPWWLYLPRVVLTGEIQEYLQLARAEDGSKYQHEPRVGTHRPTSEILKDPTLNDWQKMRLWHKNLVIYMTAWVHAHKNSHADHWTPLR